MGAQVSTSRHIATLYKRRGWSQDKAGYLGKRLGAKLLRSPDGSRAVVIVPAVDVTPPSEDGRTLQQQFEDYLRKLQRQLDKMQTPHITDIWFEAGGVLQLPAWFVQWCTVKRIRCHGVELADLPTDIPGE